MSKVLHSQRRHQRSSAHPFRFPLLHPNLGARRLLNITYRLVVFECCCGPPVQVGAGRVLPLRAEEGTQ